MHLELAVRLLQFLQTDGHGRQLEVVGLDGRPPVLAVEELQILDVVARYEELTPLERIEDGVVKRLVLADVTATITQSTVAGIRLEERHVNVLALPDDGQEAATLKAGQLEAMLAQLKQRG